MAICEDCNKEFQNRKNSQRFCSDYCRVTYHRKQEFNSKSFVCEVCNKPFKPERSTAKYCSDACKQIAYRKRIESEQKKPFILNLFVYPKSQWFDEKGDFRGHVGDYPGPMLECAMMLDSVKEIAKNPLVKENAEINIISNQKSKLYKEFVEKRSLPIFTFMKRDEFFKFRFGFIQHKHMEEYVITKITTEL